MPESNKHNEEAEVEMKGHHYLDVAEDNLMTITCLCNFRLLAVSPNPISHSMRREGSAILRGGHQVRRGHKIISHCSLPFSFLFYTNRKLLTQTIWRIVHIAPCSNCSCISWGYLTHRSPQEHRRLSHDFECPVRTRHSLIPFIRMLCKLHSALDHY